MSRMLMKPLAGICRPARSARLRPPPGAMARAVSPGTARSFISIDCSDFQSIGPFLTSGRRNSYKVSPERRRRDVEASDVAPVTRAPPR